MAFNGSGVFVRLYNWVNDKNAAIKIRADRMDAEMDGFATGLSGCVTRDGQSPATANLPMGGFKHTNAAVATARSDYATYGQLQDSAGQYVSTVGGTATAITLTPSPAITAYATGQAFKFKTGSAATGATTVAISGLTAKTVVNQDGGAIVAGQWASGQLITITYDGTNFIAQNLNFVSPVVVGDITVGSVKARTSAGVVVQNSAGTTVATFGGSTSDDTNFAGDVSAANLLSNTYTPTLTNTTNISSSTAYVSGYSRVGDAVHVFGRVGITPTASGLCVLGFSLPVASDITSVANLGGTFCTRTTSLAGSVAGDATNDRATFGIVAPSTTALDCMFSFSYTVA